MTNKLYDPKELKCGQSVTFSAHDRLFTLKRISRDCWNLAQHGLYERSRFGNLEQIREDLEHVRTTGIIPKACGRRW